MNTLQYSVMVFNSIIIQVTFLLCDKWILQFILCLQVQGLQQFLNFTETLEDVYYVTATQVMVLEALELIYILSHIY
jgi:hypothetical protein